MVAQYSGEVFWRAVRQRDGFHLARDAVRGWGAALYAALRTGDQPTALELLALTTSMTRKALPAPTRAPTGAPRWRHTRCHRTPARSAPRRAPTPTGSPGA